MPKDERSELGSNTDMQPALAFSQEPFKIATGVLQGMKDPFTPLWKMTCSRMFIRWTPVR